MAKIVLGLGTSHSPMLAQPPELWAVHGENDARNRELVFPPEGLVYSYEEALERANPDIAKNVDVEHFKVQHANLTKAIDELAKSLADAKPDAVIIISDDQDEVVFEDNMPMFSVYWGDTMPLIARVPADNAPPAAKAMAWGYGDVSMDVPVNAELGRHIIEHMIDNEFDVSHSKYLREESGGTIARRYPTPDGESEYVRVTEPRKFGMPHGFSFVVKRLMDNKPVPIVPISLNTCYPPNQPTPKRSFAFGQQIRRAVESWDTDARVVVIASGGLSHFVVDEELDRAALKAMVENDGEALSNLPKHRLNSAASETRNWVAAAGASEHLKAEILAYEPVYRTLAGTGGGWGMVRWNGSGK